MPVAHVALGSNVGDRRAHLDHALARIAGLGTGLAGSPIYETEPVGGPDDQGPYLNAVLAVDTGLAPRDLLEALLTIEAERGRVRTERWGPRTLDLDILTYDGLEVDLPGLTVPHPEIRNRLFVLAPLADVAPGLTDRRGPYAASLRDRGTAGLVRRTGPVDPGGRRWMAGLADAVALTDRGGSRIGRAHEDWVNTSGDAFGGFLAAVALESVRDVRPGAVPSHLTYRYLHPVPAGSTLELRSEVHRSGGASSDLTVSVIVDGLVAGRCAVSLVDRPLRPTDAPAPPAVLGLEQATPVTRLIGGLGRELGTSIRSWTPLERWDLPDLATGDEPVLRAWCPNVVLGTDDPFLRAATIVMPIDALIWPATMHRLGGLGGTSGHPSSTVSTPTLELTARFAGVGDDAWYLGEATIDHLTDRSVSGTVRVWGLDGGYTAVGHSLNLLRRI